MTVKHILLREYCERAGLPHHGTVISRKLSLPQFNAKEARYEVYEYPHANSFVGLVENARVFGPGFLATDSGECILHGLTSGNYATVLRPQLKKYLVDSGTEIELNLDKDAPFIDEEAVLLWGTDNFGHWIFTYLHRLTQLFYLPQLPTRKFILWDGVPKRFIPWVVKMGVSEEDIIRVPDCSRIAKLWVPSVVHYRDTDEQICMLPEAVHVFRHQILKYRALGLSPQDKRERIYISRSKAKWRKVSNEDELVDRLSQLGIRAVCIEDLSVDEQIDLISRAELIVLTAGASSPITMLAPKDVMIIEIGIPKFVGVFGSRLWTQVLGQRYRRVNATTDDSGGNLALRGIDRDIIVPVEEIASLV